MPGVEKPSFSIGVIMQRRRANSRWADVVWEPFAVVPSPASGTKLLFEQPGLAQWLHDGLKIELHRDEDEGYYLNLTAPDPRVFVLWRMEGDDAALPVQVTVSSEEASRWLDGGHSVDGVKMPREIFVWVGEYVEKNYRPKPPEKRIKPRSFLHPKDRV